MKKLRVIVMGTTDFAVPALDALIQAGHEVAAVVAQPDRPNRRGKKISFLPMKKRALELDIPVLQPENIKTPEAVETLKAYQADVFVVAAYGQILSEAILTIPPMGAVNIHGSLLPEYRGAAPVHRAILDGKTVSGVTIMQMDVGMDTGDMLSKAEVPIDDTTTAGELYDLLAQTGADLLIKTLEGLCEGTVSPQKQDDALASYADKIDKTEGCIDWQQPSVQVIRQINGMDSFPSAYTLLKGEKIKCFHPVHADWQGEETPGTILQADAKQGLVVKTADGAVAIGEIQAPGKKRMATAVYLRGNVLPVGDVFEKEI